MKLKPPVVISLYDHSGVMVEPWAEVGCECICVDIQHLLMKEKVKEVGKGIIRFVWGDIRTWTPRRNEQRRAIILFAFPPCTHVANSGAAFWAQKGTAMLRDSLEMFSAAEHAAKWSGLPYMIENPPGKFSSHIREPNHIFQPWQYGDLWSKPTCLWTGNGFVNPRPTNLNKPKNLINKVWSIGGSGDPKEAQRKRNKKSKTPPGLARAVFESNKHFIV